MKAEKKERPAKKSSGRTVTNEMRKKYGFNMAKVKNQTGGK